MQRLLRDAQDLAVARRARLPAPPSTSRSIATPWTRWSIVDLLAQRAGQPVALELGRAQPEDQRAQLGQRLAGQLADALELRPGRVGVAVQQRRGGLGG